MSEIVDLGNRESIAEFRDSLVTDLPNMLQIAGATDQIEDLRFGRHGEVVDWFRQRVATTAHGAVEGEFGLTPDQTRDFNPLAQRHGLVAPQRLWKPGDPMPDDARVGDFVNYSVTPDFESLAREILEADETLVVDATVDGTIGRIDTALGVAARSAAGRGRAGEVTVLTGMRAVESREGATGLYRQFLPEGTDPNIPVEQAFPSAADAALAILSTRMSQFELLDEIADDEAGHKPVEKIHPTLGSREWMLRRYWGVHAETGAELLVTVVNGEAIAPTGQEMNRSTTMPAPRAATTLLEYLSTKPEAELAQNRNLAISYAHLARIGSELVRATQREGLAQLGKVTLVGSMPQPATWNRITAGGMHNGGTLGYKEVYPLIKAMNALLGRSAEDLGV